MASASLSVTGTWYHRHCADLTQETHLVKIAVKFWFQFELITSVAVNNSAPCLNRVFCIFWQLVEELDDFFITRNISLKAPTLSRIWGGEGGGISLFDATQISKLLETWSHPLCAVLCGSPGRPRQLLNINYFVLQRQFLTKSFCEIELETKQIFRIIYRLNIFDNCGGKLSNKNKAGFTYFKILFSSFNGKPNKA